MINKLLLRLVIPLATWLLVYYSSLINMVGVWDNSKTYEHCYLILPISLWLIWQEKDRLKNVPFSTSWAPVILLVFPCLLWIIGRTASIAFFEHVAAVTSLQLILWAMLGNAFAKSIYFPILYLSFCIPFGEELIPYLQEITADISVYLVRLSGVPIYREGMYLTLPNGQFKVAEACSGIRFLISSIALGTLFSYVFFQKWWKFFLFVIFSSIFPIIANGIRAYGIIMIGNFSNMKYAAGADHLIYGWVFFSLVIVFMFFVAWYFQDKTVNLNNSAILQTQTPKAEQTTSVLKTVSFIVIILSGFITWNYSISNYIQQFKTSAIVLPEPLKQIPTSNWKISFQGANQAVLASTPASSTELFVARYFHGQQQGELISSQNALYDKEKWSVRGQTTFKSQNNIATELLLTNIYGNSKRIVYWYCINDYCSNNQLKIKLIEAYSQLLNKDIFEQIVAMSSTTLSGEQLQDLFLSYSSYLNQVKEN